MTNSLDGQNYTIKFDRGEKLVAELTKFIKKNKIAGGWIVGLGGLTWAEIGFYQLDSKKYEFTRIGETLELSNLTGNIAWSKDKPALHLHATVAGKDLRTKAGHLKEAEVGGTVEVFVSPLADGQALRRSIDSDTGLNLLTL